MNRLSVINLTSIIVYWFIGSFQGSRDQIKVFNCRYCYQLPETNYTCSKVNATCTVKDAPRERYTSLCQVKENVLCLGEVYWYSFFMVDNCVFIFFSLWKFSILLQEWWGWGEGWAYFEWLILLIQPLTLIMKPNDKVVELQLFIVAIIWHKQANSLNIAYHKLRHYEQSVYTYLIYSQLIHTVSIMYQCIIL